MCTVHINPGLSYRKAVVKWKNKLDWKLGDKALLLSLVRRLREAHLTLLNLLFCRVKLDLAIFYSFTSLYLF